MIPKVVEVSTGEQISVYVEAFSHINPTYIHMSVGLEYNSFFLKLVLS